MHHVYITSLDELDSVTFTPNFAVIFYHTSYEVMLPAAFEVLSQRYSGIDVIGCSGESLIDADVPHFVPHRPRQFVMMLLKLRENSFAFRRLEDDTLSVEKIDARYNAFMFSTANDEKMEALVSSLQRQLQTFAVFGAVASSSMQETARPSLLINGRVFHTGTLLWLLDTDAYTLHGTSFCSFEPLQIAWTITAVQGRKILAIENAPALETVERVVGALSPEGLADFDYPLFIESDDEAPDAVLATLERIDRTEGTLSLSRYPRVGATLRLALPVSRKEHERRIDLLAERFRGCDAAFLFGCKANKQHWGEMGPVYYMQLSRSLGRGFAGFHSNGAIGPCVADRSSRLQNQTLTLVALYEK